MKKNQFVKLTIEANKQTKQNKSTPILFYLCSNAITCKAIKALLSTFTESFHFKVALLPCQCMHYLRALFQCKDRAWRSYQWCGWVMYDESRTSWCQLRPWCEKVDSCQKTEIGYVMSFLVLKETKKRKRKRARKKESMLQTEVAGSASFTVCSPPLFFGICFLQVCWV